MTQAASIDLGAMVANRQAQSARPASKPQTEFVSAYRQATEDNREPVKQRDADRSNVTRPDRESDTSGTRDAKTESTTETAPPKDTEQAEAPKPQTEAPEAKLAQETPQSPDQAPGTNGEQAPGTNGGQAPGTTGEQVPVTTGEQAPVVEAPPQTPEEAQALLSLMLATGAHVVTAPVVQADAATEAAAVQAVQIDADATSQAQAKLTAMVAETAKAAEGQAKANPEAPADAQETARTPDAAKLPAYLAQAALGLGKVTMQAEKTVQPTVPVTAEEGLQNLSLQLLADTEATNTGSNTLATLLDGAESIETKSPFVTLLTEESDTELLTETGEHESTTPLLNGERPLTESTKSVQAQNKESATAPAQAEDIMPQILKYADQIKANQQNSIKLQLFPENLGKLDIKVTSQAGVIWAQLSADTPQVKSMLESQVAMLQRTFAEMGLKVDKVEVMLSSSSLQSDSQQSSMTQGEFQQHQQQQQHDARRGLVSGSGYEQWLGEDPVDDEAYAASESVTAVNYVA